MWRRGSAALALAVAVLFLADAAVFRSGLYFYIASPETALGQFERELRVERKRPRDGRRQILILGDSRSQAIRPRIAQEAADGSNVAFASVSVKGSTPRAWYYLLRALDPRADRYAALLIGVDNFDDNNDGSQGESTGEVEMPISALHFWDVWDFPWTFRETEYRRDAVLECLLMGSAFKKDLQEMLSHAADRIRAARRSREAYARFMWEYEGVESSLAGLEMDWRAKTVKVPDGASQFTHEVLEDNVRDLNAADDGRKAALRREWIGRIARHYQGSRTLLLFVRVPGLPIPAPADLEPPPIRGILRDLATAQPNIVLLNEHLLDSWARPEYFYDAVHMNAVGGIAISKVLGKEVPSILAERERD